MARKKTRNNLKFTAKRYDVVLYSKVMVYLGLLLGEIDPETMLTGEMIRVEGDLGALRHFLNIWGVPSDR